MLIWRKQPENISKVLISNDNEKPVSVGEYARGYRRFGRYAKRGNHRKYAIGGAFAAILHYEPISTIDLDIFFFLTEKNASSILSLSAIYDYAEKRGFSFDHEFVNIHGWLVQFVEASHSRL